MTHTTYRSAADWLSQPRYQRTTVIDPDGWDRKNFERSWNELISETEFQKRLSESTVFSKTDE